MMPDKMTINHSNHLFVPVAFVFCVLSLLVHISDSYDYIDSRQYEKNLDAVSRYRNNTQRLPNYNWKPPDKYYGPREESTEEKAGMEFIKSGDPEQRVVNPRIKKMQKISRQEREKWAAYKRNKNGKLALDNVEESTRASKLTNDESIMMESVEYNDDENVNKRPDVFRHSFEDSIESPEADMLDSASATQSSVDMKNLQASFWLKQSADTNEYRSDNDKLSNKKLESSRRSIDIKNLPTKRIEDASPTIHRQYQDYQISNIIEELIDDQNATTDSEKSENEEDRVLSFIENSNSEESTSQELKDRRVLKNATDTRRSFTKFFKSDKSSKRKSGFRGSSAKEYPRQSSFSRQDNEKSDEDSKGNKKIVTVNSLTRKGKEEKDGAGGKNAIGEPLNHEGSFHPARWGMSVSSPPVEFLKDVFPGSMHRPSKKSGNKKDRSHHLPDRFSISVTTLFPKTFQKNMHGKHETGRLAVKTKSRPSKVKEFFVDRSSTPQRHWNLPKQQFQQPKTGKPRTGKHNKEHTKDLVGKDPNELYNFGYYASNDVGFNNEIPRILKFLMDIVHSNVEPNVIHIPMECRMQLPNTLFHI